MRPNFVSAVLNICNDVCCLHLGFVELNVRCLAAAAAAAAAAAVAVAAEEAADELVSCRKDEGDLLSCFRLNQEIQLRVYL